MNAFSQKSRWILERMQGTVYANDSVLVIGLIVVEPHREDVTLVSLPPMEDVNELLRMLKAAIPDTPQADAQSGGKIAGGDRHDS